MSDIVNVDSFPSTKVVTKIQLSVPQFVLNATEMDVYVAMYTEEMQFVESSLIHIPPDIYKDWGADDSHIINYVLSQLKSSSKTAPVN